MHTEPATRRDFLGQAGIGLAASLLGRYATAVEAAPGETRLSPLRVSNDSRSLVRTDGQPFFWLADTAWFLVWRLSREDAEHYLKTRAAQGYTVVQLMLLPAAGLPIDRTTNASGAHPFDVVTPDRLEPNAAYFEHVDWLIRRAEQLGLYVLAFPVWRDNWRKMTLAGGVTTQPFLTAGNALQYGRFVGNRFRNCDNLLWGLGGDKLPADERESSLMESLVAGIKTGGAGQLMTYHPGGGKSSSENFHAAGWLAFNMCQSGHRLDAPVWDMIGADWSRQPVKPVIDGESLYEDIPRPLWKHTAETPHSTAYEVRRATYAGLFAGAFGCTYGANSVFQFYEPGGPTTWYPTTPWRQALHFPAAGQMQYLRRLMLSRPATGRMPDQAFVVSSNELSGQRVSAVRAAERSYAMIYTAAGKPFVIDLERLSGTNLVVYWYNPRSGVATPAGQFRRSGHREFIPPADGTERDWVLVIDDASRAFGEPGRIAS